jgi:dihydroorotate dehydrogenase (NAD+) catalytic subunit
MMTPFYDPRRSYEENYEDGPFGAFADKKVLPISTPTATFLGIPLAWPLGIPAGPLLNSNFVNAALDKGWPVCVYKTVRSRRVPCHPAPNVLAVSITGRLTLARAKKPLVATKKYTSPLSITNSFGVPSQPPSVWQPDLRRALAHVREGQLVIGSFQGTPPTKDGDLDLVADCVHTAQLVAATGVKVMELNLSCPNEGTACLLCFDVERVAHIVTAITNQVSVPLLLKLAYFASQDQLEQLVRAVGKRVAGLSAINTIPAPIVDRHGNPALPGPGRLVSGVCGHAIRWAGLDMVKRLNAIRSAEHLNFAIIGGGGVMNKRDYSAYRRAGADLVMSATGAMWNPYLAQEIKPR